VRSLAVAALVWALTCAGCGAAAVGARDTTMASRSPGPHLEGATTHVALEVAEETTDEIAGPADTVSRAEEMAPWDEADPNAPRAWLYRVSREGTPDSYLLGTMHVGVGFGRALPRPLDRALLDARVVVMEIDLLAAQRYLAEPSPVRHRVRRVDQVLPRETWARLTTELSFVASPEQIARVPAGMLAIYLRQVRMAEVEASDDGFWRAPGTASATHLDRWIYDWAMQWCVPFVALETPRETVAALSGVSRRDPVEALRAMIDDPERARAEARTLRAAYLSLDEARIHEALAVMSEAEREATFTLRNDLWMARLAPVLAEGGAFVAVGLGHLVGEASLVARLREQGYRVERVEGDGGFAPREASDGWIWSHAPRRAD
jgi:uncharacterized protein YbaP (TraB family)